MTRTRSAGQAQVWVASSRIATLTSTGLVAIAVSRTLGADGKGLLTLVQTLASLGVSIGLLGVPALITRVWNTPEERLLRAATRVAYSLTVGVTAALTLGIVGLSTTDIAPPELVLPAALLALALALQEISLSRMQATQRFGLLSAHRTAAVVCTGATAALTAFATKDPEATVWAITAATIAFAVVARLQAPRASAHIRHAAAHSIIRNPHFRQGLVAHGVLLLLLLAFRLDVIILGALATPTDVGYYSVAFNIAEVPWLAVNAYAVTLLPQLARASAPERTALCSVATRRSIHVAIVTSALLVGINPTLIVTLFGPEFDASVPAFLALVPGIVAFIPIKIAVTANIASGTAWGIGPVLVTAVVANVGGNLLLIPAHGATGAAGASSVAYVASWLHLRRRSKSLHTILSSKAIVS